MALLYSNCLAHFFFFYNSGSFIINHFILLQLQICSVEKQSIWGPVFLNQNKPRIGKLVSWLFTDLIGIIFLALEIRVYSFLFFFCRWGLVGNVETIFYK